MHRTSTYQIYIILDFLRIVRLGPSHHLAFLVLILYFEVSYVVNLYRLVVGDFVGLFELQWAMEVRGVGCLDMLEEIECHVRL